MLVWDLRFICNNHPCPQAPPLNQIIIDYKFYLVSYPAHALFHKSGKDQWDSEIGSYYVALSLQQWAQD